MRLKDTKGSKNFEDRTGMTLQEARLREFMRKQASEDAGEGGVHSDIGFDFEKHIRDVLRKKLQQTSKGKK